MSPSKEIHARIYDHASAILKRYDPCGIRTNSAGEVVCNDGRPCCYGCEHLSPSGCTTRTISCRTWLCGTASRRSPVAFVELRRLTRAAHEAGIAILFRPTTEQELGLVPSGPTNYRMSY